VIVHKAIVQTADSLHPRLLDAFVESAPPSAFPRKRFDAEERAGLLPLRLRLNRPGFPGGPIR
jgi:hypothetical protein